MSIGKYKYYFRKPRSEITKDIFSWLLIGGAITFAVTSPYFIQNLLRARRNWRKYPRRKILTTFDRLRRGGFILITNKNGQIHISLTSAGRKKAGMFQIDSLGIKKPKQWDEKWRLLVFDIPEKRKIAREALRGKLQELGFHKFQQSIWMHPYDCCAEVELLKDFFGLTDAEMQLVVAENIGQDGKWKQIFKLSI